MGLSVKSLDWFLGSLATAEKAAAVQCERLSEEFERLGMTELARRYSSFAEEEWAHFNSVSALISTGSFQEDKRVASVLGLYGRFGSWSAAERMYSIHVVFEPSALSNLAGIAKVLALESLPADWAFEVSKTFRTILSEEGSHIYWGVQSLRPFMAKLTPVEFSRLRVNEKAFQKLIKGALVRLFDNTPNEKVGSQIVANYQNLFKRQRRNLGYERASNQV